MGQFKHFYEENHFLWVRKYFKGGYKKMCPNEQKPQRKLRSSQMNIVVWMIINAVIRYHSSVRLTTGKRMSVILVIEIQKIENSIW